jgi:retron-type reverse transcriptase
MNDNLNEWIDFRTINKEKLWRNLCKIKTKSGIDDVNIDVIKNLFDTCYETLLDIINESHLKGICPKPLKETLVIPIEKINNTIKSDEHRPINMCNIIDKIIQIEIKEQLEEFMAMNNTLSECQSGFREKHSCETAVNLAVSEWIENFVGDKVTLIIFLDLRRAFETIDINVLLKKLHESGIRARVLSWFQTWLSDRTQRTKFNDKISNVRPIDIGVPQGTPLSCTLFNIYINDSHKYVKNCKINMFADDTIIWISGENIEDMTTKLQQDLNSQSDMYRMCKLKVNVAKTKYMYISKKKSANVNLMLSIDGELIQKTNCIKYLGVMVDDQLKFKENNNLVKNKIAKKSYFMKRMQRQLDKATKLLLYKTLMVPHIDYCASILFLANEQELREIQVMMNNALRAILLRDRNTHIHDMLVELNLLDVKQRVYYDVLIFFCKMSKGLLPEYLTSKLNFIG